MIRVLRSLKQQVRTAATGLILLASTPALAQNDFICEPAPEPMISLAYESRYSEEDAKRAELDPEREADVLAALAPLDGFIDKLAGETEALYRGRIQGRKAAADCIVRQLGRWASADALSDLGSETTRLTIGSRYAAFALIAWQTLPYASDHPERAVVLDWLERRITEQMEFWSNAPPGAQTGNLRAWSALGAAAVSLQTGSDEMRDWAQASFTEVMCSANDDGSLPQEMSRGKYALHYQLHAIAPLVTGSVLLERQGVAASQNCDRALERIVAFAISDLIDGSKSAEYTGVAQSLFDGTSELNAFQLAWIEPYLLIEPSEDLLEIAKLLRPLIYTKLGGNQTALWQQ